MDPNDQPPSMPDAPDKEKMEQVSMITALMIDGCSSDTLADVRDMLTLYYLDPTTPFGEARVNKHSSRHSNRKQTTLASGWALR